MPTSLLLVGVEHADTNFMGDLIAPELIAAFRNQIQPLLTDKSLVFVEGWGDGIIRPGSRLYHSAQKSLGVSLGELAPVFGGFDPRGVKNPRKIRQVTRLFNGWPKVAESLFGLHQPEAPLSTLDLCAQISAGQSDRPLRGIPTKEDVKMARQISLLNEAFDQQYIRAFARYGENFDRCIAVIGTTHALSIAKRTGHPLVMLSERPENLRTAYLAYLAYYVWPSIIGNHRP